MQQLLSSTKSDIKALANTIETQRIAAQAAAERRASRRRPRHARTAPAATGWHWVSPTPASIPAASPRRAAARQPRSRTRAQIGKPYRYAGAGPDSFDCSGLTMMAWRQGGVSMTHGSQAQWASFPKVPIPNLQPGDLVFFGSSGPSNHHVGLYIGGGTMIEAPHTGTFVRYSTIYRPDLVSTGSRP